MYFYGCAIANTNADALTLGMATGSVTRVTNFMFVSCSWETGAGAAYITLHPNAGGHNFIACTRSGEVSFVDTTPGNGNTWLGGTGTNWIGGTGKTALALISQDSNTGITLGGDVNLYRAAAGLLQSDANDVRFANTVRVGADQTSGLLLALNTIRAGGTNTSVSLNVEAKGRLVFFD